MTTQQMILEALLSGQTTKAVQSMDKWGCQHNTYNKYINYIRTGKNQARSYPVKTNMVYVDGKHYAEHTIEKDKPVWYESYMTAKLSYEAAGRTQHTEYIKICEFLKERGY